MGEETSPVLGGDADRASMDGFVLSPSRGLEPDGTAASGVSATLLEPRLLRWGGCCEGSG